MEEKQDRIFMNTTATGKHAWAPSCGILPPETEEASMGEVIPLEGNKKGRKVGGAEKLAGQIDRLVNAVESKSIATSLMMKMQLGNSILEVMEVVSSLPGCEPTNTLWIFATRLFLNQEKQEMFSTMKTPNVKLAWLTYEFNNQ
ncbi:unnamed protein product [Prunus armeniaca]